MKPAPFDYEAPKSISDAVGLLQSAPSPKILAGGQSMVPMLNMRLLSVETLIDINRIEGLPGIEKGDNALTVGALTRHSELLGAGIEGGWPLVFEALSHVAHPAIRNRGTVCGSIAHADPAAELPTVLSALEGVVVAEGPGGRREISAEDFFLSIFMTALSEDEMVVAVRFPTLGEGSGAAFEEFARRPGDFALAGVAAVLSREGDRISDARIALCNGGPTPERMGDVEAWLKSEAGSTQDAASLFAEAGRRVAAACDPDGDIHGSPAYRKQLFNVLTKKALERAWKRAGGR